MNYHMKMYFNLKTNSNPSTSISFYKLPKYIGSLFRYHTSLWVEKQVLRWNFPYIWFDFLIFEIVPHLNQFLLKKIKKSNHICEKCVNGHLFCALCIIIVLYFDLILEQFSINFLHPYWHFSKSPSWFQWCLQPF